MLERVRHGKVIWINLKNPTSAEVNRVMKELDIPPSLVNDLTTPIPRNYACRAEDTVKVVLDFPVVKRLEQQHVYEVKFLISKNSLVTVHYEEMEGIERFRSHTEVAGTLRRTQKKLTGADLFVSLMNHLYAATEAKIDYLEIKLTNLEGTLFHNNEKEMVMEISHTGKRLISFRHTLDGHKDVITDTAPLLHEIFNSHYASDMEGLLKQYMHFSRRTKTLSQTLTALRDTNTAMLYTKQNEVMKIFTIMAFVTFPLTLFSSLFGMNTVSAPIIGGIHDFWIIIGIMVVATICFFFFFKYKRWIQ